MHAIVSIWGLILSINLWAINNTLQKIVVLLQAAASH